MKPVNLNQLLFHPKTATLSFFQSAHYNLEEFDVFLQDMLIQLDLHEKKNLVTILEKNKANIKKILKSHPEKAHGFFISEDIQGYISLESSVESYCLIGNNFHVRPVIEELYVNPEYLLVNVSLYDISIYRADFQHIEIVQHHDFDQMTKTMGTEGRARFFTPQYVGLLPYKNILALKTIAQKVKDMSEYHSIPVIITGLEELKGLFLKYFTTSSGIISHFQEDFYEKTCVQILEKCRNFRPAVMDYYSAQLKDRLKRLVKSKRFITDLKDIITAAHEGRIVHLIIPTEKKLWGRLDFQTGEFEIHKRLQKKNASVDILNELAEEVMKQGGNIKVLGPHFFPQESYVLAILRG